MREKLHAVVVIGIMGRGNYNPGLKIVLANQTGHSRGGDYAGEGYGGTASRQARCEHRGNVGAGFASVHPDQDVRGAIRVVQIPTEGPASCEQRAVIQGRNTWDTADAVGTEKLFRHKETPE